MIDSIVLSHKRVLLFYCPELMLPLCYLMNTGAYATSKSGKEDRASLRPPSYTDRILCHSQIDSRHLLRILKYDMCDAITLSDHRPVSAAIELTVKEPEVIPFASFGAGQSKGSVTAPVLPESTQLIKIRLYDLRITWFDPANPSDSSDSFDRVTPRLLGSFQSLASSFSRRTNSFGSSFRADPYTCMVYFPLANEDPFEPLRKSVTLNQAISLGTNQGGTLLTAGNMQNIHSFNVGQTDNEVFELRSLACSRSAR